MINDEKVFFAYNKFNVTLCLEYTYAYFFSPSTPATPPLPLTIPLHISISN